MPTTKSRKARPTVTVSDLFGPNPLLGATEGREAEVVKSYFYNGEGWYRLRDTATGEVFESPDIFWSES